MKPKTTALAIAGVAFLIVIASLIAAHTGQLTGASRLSGNVSFLITLGLTSIATLSGFVIGLRSALDDLQQDHAGLSMISALIGVIIGGFRLCPHSALLTSWPAGLSKRAVKLRSHLPE